MNLVYAAVYVYIVNHLHIIIYGFKIGGIFNQVEEGKINVQELAFRHAVSIANKIPVNDREIKFEMEPDSQIYNTTRNSFIAQKLVCNMFVDGVGAIFGPQNSDSASIIQAVCDTKEIPNMQIRWDPKQKASSCLVNLYPHPTTLSKVLLDVVKLWKWKKFTIVYENNESIMRIAELLKPKNNLGAVFKMRQLDKSGNYREVLRAVKDSGDTNIVLDCSIEILPEVLKQSQQVGLMGSEHSYIITNLDLHTIDLEPYQYSGTNITGFSLLNSVDVEDITLKLSEFTANGETPTNFTSNAITVATALTYDSVKLFALAASSMEIDVKPTPCDSSETSVFGYSLINFMKVSVITGLTGLIKFDEQGFRTDVEIQISELSKEGLSIRGVWNKSTGPKMFDREDDDFQPIQLIKDLKNMTFTVLIALTEPYAMRKKSSTRLEGNDQYEGYCVDLIKELSDISGFKYNFAVQENGQSGDPIGSLPNNTKKWNGMIGAVLDYKADLALADITITRERETDVDFASPYMDLGIAILYKKPISEPAGFFSFLDPFRVEVWVYVVTAYVTVSLMFFIMARISPYEWRNPSPCVQDPEELENQFTLSNSFWFTIGALMQQGSDIAPVSMSTRLAAGVWWFFTLIMVSCYTANLAAFLSVENPSSAFDNVEALAKQTEIKYGAKKNGATFKFFRDSSNKIYQQMHNYMVANPDVMVDSSKAGVIRAEEDNYAFLMESTSIEYETERRCTLTQIGKQLDSKGYGIAMRKGSWYLSTFSQHILKLQEKGKLAYLKRKWWKEKYAGSCAKTDSQDAETLGMANVGGVFIVLVVGIGISIAIAILELLYYVWTVSEEENVPLKERLMWELKFFLRCHGSIKPAIPQSSENSSNK